MFRSRRRTPYMEPLNKETHSIKKKKKEFQIYASRRLASQLRERKLKMAVVSVVYVGEEIFKMNLFPFCLILSFSPFVFLHCHVDHSVFLPRDGFLPKLTDYFTRKGC